MSEMVCRFCFVCHFSVAGLSHEISARWEKCPALDQSGCEHSRLQDAHFPNRCQCFDAKTVTATLVSTPTITGKSTLVVLSSHQQQRPLQREAFRSAMIVRRQQISSRACRSANCLSEVVIDYLVQQKVPKTRVRNRETFSGSRPASHCQCSCGSCGYQSTR